MNRESVASWIGLKLSDSYEVVDFLGEGGQHAVFKIVRGENARVIKILKSHLSSTLYI